jgi:hypothetical protein
MWGKMPRSRLRYRQVGVLARPRHGLTVQAFLTEREVHRLISGVGLAMLTGMPVFWMILLSMGAATDFRQQLLERDNPSTAKGDEEKSHG